MNSVLAKSGNEMGAPKEAVAEAPLSSGTKPVVRVFSELPELSPACQRLFQEAEPQSLFLGRGWFENFVRTGMSAGEQSRIYAAENPHSQDAPGMLLMRHSAHSAPFPHTRKLSSLTSYYSCLFAPHLRPGVNTQTVLNAIASKIAEERPGWDAVEISPVDVDSRTFGELVAAFRQAGFVVQTFFASGNWYLPVNGRNFADYAATLPSVLRNTLSRKKKKLEKSGRARIEIVTGDNLEAAIEAYTKVYSASWKNPEPFPEFMPGLIRTCAAEGSLRLGLIHVDGEPAAAQLWIVHRRTAFIYKLAYDERFAELSVGTILSAALFEHALDVDRVNEVDYLSGDDAYKKLWMSHRRERWGILALNPRTLRGALAIARHIGGRSLKRAAVAFGNRFRRAQPDMNASEQAPGRKG